MVEYYNICGSREFKVIDSAFIIKNCCKQFIGDYVKMNCGCCNCVPDYEVVDNEDINIIYDWETDSGAINCLKIISKTINNVNADVMECVSIENSTISNLNLNYNRFCIKNSEVDLLDINCVYSDDNYASNRLVIENTNINNNLFIDHDAGDYSYPIIFTNVQAPNSTDIVDDAGSTRNNINVGISNLTIKGSLFNILAITTDDGFCDGDDCDDPIYDTIITIEIIDTQINELKIYNNWATTLQLKLKNTTINNLVAGDNVNVIYE